MANTTADLTTEPIPLRSDPWRIAWNILASNTLLVSVLLAMALLLAVAAWLPQSPDSAADPVAFSRWLAETQARFGNATALLRQIGVLSLERSPALRVLIALIGLNLIVRLIESVQVTWRARRFPCSLRATRPDVALSTTATSELSLDDIAAAWRQRRFRIVREGDELCADCFPWAEAALIAAYAGALLLLLSLVVSEAGGWRARNLMLGVGQPVTSVGHGTLYSLRLDALTQANVGRVALLSETDLVGEGNVAPGQPMRLAGLTVFINGTGPAIRASATLTDGRPLRLLTSAASTPEAELLLLLTRDDPDRFFAVPDAELVVRLSRGATNSRPIRAQVYRSRTAEVIFEDDIPPDGRVEVDAGRVIFVLGAETYVVLDVVRNPGALVTATGMVALALGLAVTLFWPVRRLWAIADSNGTRLVADQAQSAEFFAFAQHPADGESATFVRLARWGAWAGWRIGLMILSALAGMVVALSLMRSGMIGATTSTAPALLAAWLIGCAAAVLPRREAKWIALALALIALVAVLIWPGVLFPSGA